MAGKPVPLHERFWKHVAMGDGCWQWRGVCRKNGYGQVGVKTAGGRSVMASAHRVAYALVNGPIPAGMHVMHTCDNPGCVRPDHLKLGTRSDNMKDAAAKGRLRTPRTHGEAHPSAKLTAAQVQEILASNESQRDLARKYGVSFGTISHIKRRRTWT